MFLLLFGKVLFLRIFKPLKNFTKNAVLATKEKKRKEKKRIFSPKIFNLTNVSLDDSFFFNKKTNLTVLKRGISSKITRKKFVF